MTESNEIRLVALDADQKKRLDELVERIIYRRDQSVGDEKREMLANDANLLSTLAASYEEEGLDGAEAGHLAAVLQVRKNQGMHEDCGGACPAETALAKLRSTFGPAL